MYQIERNVARKRKPPYYWWKMIERMSPGDSVLVKNSNECISFAAACLKLGKKMSRELQEDGSVRCWLEDPAALDQMIQ